MHPELHLPFGLSIPTYGFCMMIGFLSAVWMAMKRAMRVKCDPDVILNVSFIALLAGVGGARLFYVAHYWRNQFADLDHPLLAALDIRKGGLEFLGGLLGASLAIAIYLVIKRHSLRVYSDILAPSTMWGLAIGRIGCFFNGCCFGGVCADPQTHEPQYAWCVQFPYGSPAQMHQWENRELTLPAELIMTTRESPVPVPVENGPGRGLSVPIEKRNALARKAYDAQVAYEAARRESPDSPETRKLEAAAKAARQESESYAIEHGLGFVKHAMSFPSREAPERGTSPSELEAMAAAIPSLPVHPAQLYDVVNALLLSALLTAAFHIRRRHGVVMGLMFVLYPVPRILLEAIRVDNPLHGGLTISQWVSVGMLLGGVAYLVYLYRYLPERCPRAVAWTPPLEVKAA